MMSETEFRRRFLELSLDRTHPARQKLAAFRGEDLTTLFAQAQESGRDEEWLIDQARKARAWAAAAVQDAANFNHAG